MTARVLLLVLAAIATPAWAQLPSATDLPVPPAGPAVDPATIPPPEGPRQPLATARIDGDALHRATGRIAVNQAAGGGHIQANQTLIAPDGDSNGALRQTINPGLASLGGGDVQLAGAAFAGSRGALAVNQTAGHANAQANLLAIGTRPSAEVSVARLDDHALAGVSGASGLPLDRLGARAATSALLSADAFRGSRGIVQLNQSAGSGNSASNVLVLRLPGAGP